MRFIDWYIASALPRYHFVPRLCGAASGEPTQRILSVYFPEKAKKTQMIAGTPAEAAADLVKRLRDDARVI
jgi:electron transfer flavoprotein beta subunit